MGSSVRVGVERGSRRGSPATRVPLPTRRAVGTRGCSDRQAATPSTSPKDPDNPPHIFSPSPGTSKSCCRPANIASLGHRHHVPNSSIRTSRSRSWSSPASAILIIWRGRREKKRRIEKNHRMQASSSCEKRQVCSIVMICGKLGCAVSRYVSDINASEVTNVPFH